MLQITSIEICMYGYVCMNGKMVRIQLLVKISYNRNDFVAFI